MPEQILTEPHFTIDPRAEKYTDDEHGITVGEGALCLRTLQHIVTTSPDVCVAILNGKAEPTDENAAARGTIGTVLRARLDRFMEYDEESDAGILQHPAFMAARARLEEAHGYDVTKNGLGTGHVHRSHPEADSRRDAVRTTRLALYVQRVMDWQTQQKKAAPTSEQSSSAA